MDKSESLSFHSLIFDEDGNLLIGTIDTLLSQYA